jgi:hypothetical protein
MMLKSKWDHYQGRNQAWKSAIQILQVLLLKWHINFKKNKKNLKFLPQVNIVFCIYHKNFSQIFYILTPHQRSQRSLKGMFIFLRIMCTCELKGLGEWLLVVEKSKGWPLWRMRSPVQVWLEVIGSVSCHWQWELVGWKLFKQNFDF